MKLAELPNHHAVLIASSEREILANNFWGELTKDSLLHNYFNQTVLDIDTVRELISLANSPQNGRRVLLISFHTATLPAQNAMLKVLEEPKSGVSFILVTSNRENLLPTVLSRVYEIKNEGLSVNDKEKIQNHVQEFFKTKPTERMKLKFITELLNKEDEEGRKDREAVRGFILLLAEYAKEKIATEKNITSKHLFSINEMSSYASDPSGSGKVLLEYLSLYLPQIK